MGQDETPNRGSISRWIPRLRECDDSATMRIWDRYKAQMRAVAHRELGSTPRSVADEDDVVVSAFAAFLRRTSAGAYDSMSNRDDLWRLLGTITRTYAWKQSRFLTRLRRFVTQGDRQRDEDILKSLIGRNPPPEMLVSLSETLAKLLHKLEAPELRELAMDRLSGYTNEEIATKQGRSVRTIERRLAMVRSVWERELD